MLIRLFFDHKEDTDMRPAYLTHPKTFLKAIYTTAGENMNRVMAIILLTAGSAAWG